MYHFFIPSQQIGITIKSNPVVANTDDKLRGEYFRDDIKRHYNNSVGLHKQRFEQVQWESIRLATRKHANRSQMLKCLHNQWPTNERNHKWGISDANICQLCNTEVETWQHVLQCNSIHANRQRAQSIATIKKELKQLKTCPDVENQIMHILQQWSLNKQPQPPAVDFRPY